MSKISTLDAIYTYRLCILPFFQVLLFLFIYGYFPVKNIRYWLFAFALTYFSGFCPLWLSKLPYLQFVGFVNIYTSYLHYLGVYFLFIGASILVRENRYAFVAWLLALSIASFTCFPAIIGETAAWLATDWILRRHKRDLYLLIGVLCFGISQLIFYQFIGNHLNSQFSQIGSAIFFAGDAIVALKNIIGNLFVFIIIPLAVYVLIGIPVIKANLHKYLCHQHSIWLWIIFASFCCYLLLYNMRDSFQLFRNITSVILSIGFILMIIKMLINRANHLYLGLFALLLSTYGAVNYYTIAISNEPHDTKFSNDTRAEDNCLVGILTDDILNTKEKRAWFSINLHNYGYLRYSNTQNVFINPSYEYINATQNSEPIICLFEAQNEDDYIKQLIDQSNKSCFKYIIVEKDYALSTKLEQLLIYKSTDSFSGSKLYTFR